MITLRSKRSFNLAEADEIWFIVRKINQFQTLVNQTKKCKWVTDLAPSQNLYSKYLQLKDSHIWNDITFLMQYVPTFIKEIKANPKALELIDELIELGEHKNIQLVCFCLNENLCHRSIIGGILMNRAKELGKENVIECNPEYIKYSL